MKRKRSRMWKVMRTRLETKILATPLQLAEVLVNLRKRTREERRRQTLVWQAWQFCLKYIFPKLHYSLLEISFCKRPENISGKWRSRQNTHVIARSRLSHTNVLPYSSCSRPVAWTHYFQKKEKKRREKRIVNYKSWWFSLSQMKVFRVPYANERSEMMHKLLLCIYQLNSLCELTERL